MVEHCDAIKVINFSQVYLRQLWASTTHFPKTWRCLRSAIRDWCCHSSQRCATAHSLTLGCYEWEGRDIQKDDSSRKHQHHMFVISWVPCAFGSKKKMWTNYPSIFGLPWIQHPVDQTAFLMRMEQGGFFQCSCILSISLFKFKN